MRSLPFLILFTVSAFADTTINSRARVYHIVAHPEAQADFLARFNLPDSGETIPQIAFPISYTVETTDQS